MDFSAVTLELGVLISAVAVLAWDLTLGPRHPLGARGSYAIAAVAWTGLLLWSVRIPDGAAFGSALVQDAFALYVKQILLAAGVLTMLATLPYAQERGWSHRSGEFVVLLAFALIGGMTLVSSQEWLTLFVSFELLSLPIYSLAAIEKTRAEAPEGALKIFLFGCISSAFLLLGLALIFAATGTTFWLRVGGNAALGSAFSAGLVLVLVGFGFKIAMFPFYLWVPDTYQAAPTPLVGFLSVAPKAAGVATLLRLYFEVFERQAPQLTHLYALLAAATMIAGNLLALPQTNLKRLLAFSGVAQIGYVLLALAAGTAQGAGMALFFFVAYLFSNLGAFLTIAALEVGGEQPTLHGARNLIRRSPALATALLVFLLSLGGIPFALGFWGKLSVFLAAAQSGLWWLVFLGALLAVVALFYYLNVARQMFIVDEQGPAVLTPTVMLATVIFCALVVIGGGLVPHWFIEPALAAAQALP